MKIPCSEMLPMIGDTNVFKAITLKDSIWKPGDKGTITITFGDYNCEQCSRDVAWSYIGRYSNIQTPSMNLGYIDPPFGTFEYLGKTYTVPNNATRNHCNPTNCPSGWSPGSVIIHEFGHALGMMHEHQNNLGDSNPIDIQKNQVNMYYSCIGMGEEGANANVLDMYSCGPNNDSRCEYSGTKFDPDSIMLYPYPDPWIKGCGSYNTSNCETIIRWENKPACNINPTKLNTRLSKTDKEWLGLNYPKTTDPPVITVKFVDSDVESWKIAWVQKTVLDNFSFLGIKWVFETEQILGPIPTDPVSTDPVSTDPAESNKYMPSVINDSGTVNLTEQGNLDIPDEDFMSIKVSDDTNLTYGGLIAVVIGCVVGLVLIVAALFYFIEYITKSK